MYINIIEENKKVVTIEVLSEKNCFKRYIFSFIGNFEHLQTN